MHSLVRPLLLAGAVLVAAGAAQAQSGAKITVSGYVRDAATGENLIGVAVVSPATGEGTATNTYGFYSLTLPAPAAPSDSVRLLASYLGYERSRWATVATANASHNFRLRSISSELGGVEIVGNRGTEERIERSTRMGTINVPIAQIKNLPKLFGETDVLKVLQLLPGVQSGGEGQSGLYVRGGSPDQNLILLDGTPVYNAAHLFGFFSVFNADALNNVELIKGGFPARYGGRLSSVLDISMKEGNMQEFHGEGAVGIVAAKLTLEGPIKKDTASFLISARRTYLDILAQPFIKSQLSAEGTGGSIGYFFHDLNAKLNWKLSGRDRLYLSGYTGYDKFYARLRDKDKNSSDYSRAEANLGWGNITAGLRWNRVVNDKLFMNTHFSYSKYQFEVGQEDEQRYTDNNGQAKTSKYSLRYFSNIRDLSLKTDFDYAPSPDHYIRFGGQYILHSFRPGALQEKGNFGDVNAQTKLGTQTLASEVGLYAEDDYRLTERLKVNGGLRLNGFLVRGTFYPSIEPRLAARFLLTEQWALKASYARTSQFVHLLVNSGIGLPTDLWVPSTPVIRPQRAQQVSLGAARTLNFKEEAYELSFESYYKPMRNLIEYREGASFLGTVDSQWEDKVTSGKGWAYGGELFLQKKTGRTTGWIGYSLAWSKRRFPDLNQGRIFPYKYDRRHDVSVVVSHHFSPTFTLSATWVYGTGNATTLSQGRFLLGGGQEYDDYGDRNSFRMRAYHRFDLDLSKTKKKKWGEVVNSFSIYNVYSRRNPYYLYYQRGYTDFQGNVQEKPTYRQVSLFPIIPSFSKAFKF
ncbi:TonB-dependent receptor [Hymenobacter psychrophilus]|uniref:TonB-dependent Receptor Plug Domain n=1 Tax=Hymenobacter psychrophilus TaxID=651662 RepID=A0A1H3AWC0_9BACT|nr:TonB-dependent receptor [Hymenobacter psychrophilus]SDX33691.1 TonB-dependent Receptor Plug Domain [Hymenobacter psychrophilus]